MLPHAIRYLNFWISGFLPILLNIFSLYINTSSDLLPSEFTCPCICQHNLYGIVLIIVISEIFVIITLIHKTSYCSNILTLQKQVASLSLCCMYQFLMVSWLKYWHKMILDQQAARFRKCMYIHTYYTLNCRKAL